MRATLTTFLLFSGLACAAELSLGSGAAAPGKPVVLEMNLKDGQGRLVALQCDLEFDPDAVSVTVEAGPAAKKAEKNLATFKPARNKMKLLTMGLNHNLIGDGVVALITVTPAAGAAPGAIAVIRITNAAGATNEADSISIKSSQAEVRVEASHE